MHGSFYAWRHIAPYDMHILHKRKCEHVSASMIHHPELRHEVLWRGWTTEGNVTITHDNHEDRDFCFFLLYMLIDSFVHSILFYKLCSLYTLPWCIQVRGQTIHLHPFLDQAQGTVCERRHVPALIILVSLNLIYPWKTCWTSGYLVESELLLY